MNEDQLNYVQAYVNVVQPTPTHGEAEDWVSRNWDTLVEQGIQKQMHDVEKHVIRNIN